MNNNVTIIIIIIIIIINNNMINNYDNNAHVPATSTRAWRCVPSTVPFRERMA